MRFLVGALFVFTLAPAAATKQTASAVGQDVEIIQIVQGYAQVRNRTGLVDWVPLNVLASGGSELVVYQAKLAQLETKLAATANKSNQIEADLRRVAALYTRLQQWFMPGLIGMLIVGFVLGVVFSRQRFQKRLNGLRI